jgi:hypothetical protein
MSLTLAQMATRVLRNVQIPEDSTVPSVQALADAKQFINERARDVWSRRNWPEFFILGSYTIPASTQRIALSSITPDTGFSTSGNGYNATFFSAVSIRSGVNNIAAEDPGIIHRLQADLWANTATPTTMINRGQNGLFLMGQYSSPTVLNFYGKANFQDLTDSETWLLNNEYVLISGATGDMIKYNDRDNERAGISYQEFEAGIAKMIDAIDNQAGNLKRFVPQNPWTKTLSQGRDFSKIGVNTSR